MGEELGVLCVIYWLKFAEHGHSQIISIMTNTINQEQRNLVSGLRHASFGW